MVILGFGTLISRIIRHEIITYSWRGSLLILAAICIQCVVFGALIRPLYAKKIPKKPTMAVVEEVVPKADSNSNQTTNPAKHKLVTVEDNSHPSKRNAFSPHDGIFRKYSVVIDQTAFASHTLISHLGGLSRRSALHPHQGDIKLNPYQREDVFFGGSTYDLAKIRRKAMLARRPSISARRPSITAHRPSISARRPSFPAVEPIKNTNFTSQITIDDVVVDVSPWRKMRENLKKSFNLKIFKSATFCLVVLAMTLHHAAFLIPYTYIISLTKDRKSVV